MAQKDVGNKVPIYKLKKTDEVMKYYDEWGEGNKYDQDMVDWNYTGPKETSEVFIKYQKNKDAKIYDAGCGTGLVGEPPAFPPPPVPPSPGVVGDGLPDGPGFCPFAPPPPPPLLATDDPEILVETPAPPLPPALSAGELAPTAPAPPPPPEPPPAFAVVCPVPPLFP